jgi:hypothetical protein
MIRHSYGAALALSCLILAACSAGQPAQPTVMPFQTTPMPVTPAPAGSYPAPGTSGYPAPEQAVTTGTSEAYPAPETLIDPQGRSISALSALPIALEDAKTQFDPNATLYAIIPSQVMISNLGFPPVLPGWFYKFKAEGSAREYIVQVVNDVVTGTREIESIQPPTPLELAIDPATVKFDSDKVFASFKEKAPSLGLTVDDPKAYDLELVNLEGKGGPIWSVFDPATQKWLYSLSATSGSEVGNPRG